MRSKPRHAESYKQRDSSQPDGQLTNPTSSCDLNFTPPAPEVCVFVVAVVCFLTSLDGEFVFDDSEAIVSNKDVNLKTPWTSVFSNDFWGNKLATNTSHKSYRPLTVLTYRWSYWIAGGLHPRGFHVVNLILHGAVCVLLLPFCDLIFRGQGHHSRRKYSQDAFLSSLLFAVHPVHTECVAGVVGRADLLCAVTFLLAFLTYTRSLQGLGSKSVLWLCVSLVLSGVSTLCKEPGITVLGVCLAYDLIIHCKIDILQLLYLRKSPDNMSHWSRLPRFRISAVMATGILFLICRWQVMGSAPPTFQVVDNPHSFVNGTFLRFLNYNYIYSINCWLLLCPYWLCFDWSMGCVPVIESLSDARLLAVVALWFVSGMLIGHALKRKPDNESRSLQMCLAALLLPFLPASNLLFRVGFVVAERVLYLPSIGFVLLVVTGARKLTQRTNGHMVFAVLISLLLLSHGFRCHQRSQDWLTEKQLFESGSQVCPLNAKVQYNIAKVHGDLGNSAVALEKYELAIRLNPRYDQAMNNLGNLWKDLGDLDKAEKLLLQATAIRPEFAAAWMNLGIVQASLNKSTTAESSYHTALVHRRNYPDCLYNLGNLYLAVGRHKDALSAWRNTTLLKPSHISAWSNMLILLDNLNRLSDVELVAKEALKHNPEAASLYYNVGNALGKASQYAEAERYFLKAVGMEPDVATYQSNLAVLYHRWGRLKDAERLYHRALQLDPTSSQTRKNYNMLVKKRQNGASPS